VVQELNKPQLDLYHLLDQDQALDQEVLQEHNKPQLVQDLDLEMVSLA